MASALVLLSGVAGTFAAAGLPRQNFVSIGASTAAFGALGSLAALPRHRRRAWIPLGGGLALLAFLGTSKRADLAGPSLRIRLRRAAGRGGVAPAAAAEPGRSGV